MKKMMYCGLILALPTCFVGCSTVKPWQRNVLAEKNMLLDAYPLDASFDDHIYFSKEATSGGGAIGGGGCGCN